MPHLFKKFFCFLPLILLLSFPTTAQATPLSQSYHYPYGEIKSLITAEDSLYFSIGSVALDYEWAGNSYEFNGAFSAPSTIQTLEVDSDNLYIGSDCGLIIYDRWSYNFPPLAELKDYGSIWHISLAEDMIFLSCGFDGLYALDKKTHEEVFHLKANTAFHKTIYQDGILYIIDGVAIKRLFVIDISPFLEEEMDPDLDEDELEIIIDYEDPEYYIEEDPDDPEEELVEEPEEPEERIPVHLATISRGNSINDIAISDNKLFVADGPGGLAVYDVSKPPRIQFVKAIPFSQLQEEYDTLENNYLYLDIQDDKVFVAGKKEIHIFQILNGISFLSSYEIPEDPIYPAEQTGLFVCWENHLAVVASRQLKILELKAPDNFRTLHSFDLPGPTNSVVAKNNRVFKASDIYGIREVLIDEEKPDPFHIPGVPIPVVEDMLIIDNYLLVAAGIGLGVVDISETKNPTLVTFFPFPYSEGIPDAEEAWVQGIAIREDFAYLAAGPGGIWVVNISNPRAPRTFNHVNFGGNVHSVETEPLYRRLYAFGSPYSAILGVVRPEQPSLLKRIETTPDRSIGTIKDGYLFLGSHSQRHEPGNVTIYDVSYPYELRELVQIPLGDKNIEEITITDNMLLVALRNEGLKVYDISEIRNPTFLQEIKPPYNITSIFVQDKRVILAAHNAGFFELIFR